MPRQGQNCVKEEDEEYRGEEDGRGEEYSSEDGRGKANRTVVRKAVARRRTMTANRRAGTASTEDGVPVAEKQGRSWI